MKALAPTMVREALVNATPHDLIPETQKPVYAAALEKELSERLAWDAVDVFPYAGSQDVRDDPEKRRTVILTRVACGNKYAGHVPTELMRLGLELIKAKARLCLLGFRETNANKLRTDRSTLS